MRRTRIALIGILSIALVPLTAAPAHAGTVNGPSLGAVPAFVSGSSWALRSSLTSGPATTQFPYGFPGDRKVMGDWNGDGLVTPAVVRDGVWYLKNSMTSGSADLKLSYGFGSDIPLAGDWNGDGIDTPGVYRPSNHTFYLRNSNSSGVGEVTIQFGQAGDIPIAGDWNGNGITTVGVLRGSLWLLLAQNATGSALTSFRYGLPGDVPVVGDWDGNRTDNPGVVRNGKWFIRYSNTTGIADTTFYFGSGSGSYLAWARPRTAVPSALLGTSRWAVPTGRNVVALTFDAGSGAEGVSSILATLNRTGAVATFMLTGDFVRLHPDLARQIAMRYPVGNHTVSHPYLTKLDNTQIAAQVNGAESIISATTGQTTKPIFRFPYGDLDSRTIATVNSLGYASFWWTVDTLGWKGASAGQSAATVRAKVLGSLRPGEIVLMHVGAANDGTTLDADALPGIISDLRARGYGFITLRQYL